MKHILEKYSLDFPRYLVKWLELTGEVDKFTDRRLLYSDLGLYAKLMS